MDETQVRLVACDRRPKCAPSAIVSCFFCLTLPSVLVMCTGARHVVGMGCVGRVDRTIGISLNEISDAKRLESDRGRIRIRMDAGFG